ncbi:hypothetical protein ACFQ3N_13495 [Virgibacillus byunsanensis]|uniref:Uncharacterized protein n=1 Tax=Virgibacillus byunsanensis TaxID=570945 RepID=A0ABW3LRB6_9BACI
MTIMTKKDLRELEEYFYCVGYKHWYPFPKELETQLMDTYGNEPFPHEWNEQDIFEGSRKIIIKYFKNNSN